MEQLFGRTIEESRGCRGDQDQSILAVEQHHAVRQIGKELIQVLLEGQIRGLVAANLLAQQIQLAGKRSPFILALDLYRLYKFSAGEEIDALRNGSQGPQDAKGKNARRHGGEQNHERCELQRAFQVGCHLGRQKDRRDTHSDVAERLLVHHQRQIKLVIPNGTVDGAELAV